MIGKTKKFEEMAHACIYSINYRTLLELGASAEMLKAYEEYKKAPLDELQSATRYITVWKQAKTAEAVKEAYLKAQRQQEKMEADNKERQDFGIMAAAEIKKYLC